MALDTYGTADLMGVVQKKSKFTALYLALFYPNVYTSNSEDIYLDEVDDEVDIAVDKSSLKSVMRSLYIESCNIT